MCNGFQPVHSALRLPGKARLFVANTSYSGASSVCPVSCLWGNPQLNREVCSRRFERAGPACNYLTGRMTSEDLSRHLMLPILSLRYAHDRGICVVLASVAVGRWSAGVPDAAGRGRVTKQIVPILLGNQRCLGRLFVPWWWRGPT